MDFEQAVGYLLSLGRELAAPTQAAAAKFNLENIQLLARHLGHPENRYPSAHIAGTNGKGSTAAFLQAVLREAGYRTGLYTSPHLERINERIQIDGEPIPDQAFAEIFTRIHQLIEALLADATLRAHPTFFECVTAIAFLYFAGPKWTLRCLKPASVAGSTLPISSPPGSASLPGSISITKTSWGTPCAKLRRRKRASSSRAFR